MSEIKVGDKVLINRVSSRPLREDEIAKYSRYFCPIEKKNVKVGVNKHGYTSVNIRVWDETAFSIVTKITDKRIGVVHKNNPNEQANFFAKQYVKKEQTND